jgi:hypothetical protein
MPATRTRWGRELEQALLKATGKRFSVKYHRGTARGWFDVTPCPRDCRTVRENGTERLLQGAELEQARKDRPWALEMSSKQRAVLKNLFGEYYQPTSNVPGDEEWLVWIANGRQGPEPRKGFRDWD